MSESLSSTISAAISSYPPNNLNPDVSQSLTAAVSPVSSSILSQSVQSILLQRDAVRNPLPPTAILEANPYPHSKMSELQRGVIYALNHYSPFISIPGASRAHPSQSGNDHSNNNLGPEDVAEVRQMTSAVAATSFHEHARRSEAGKCQSGGELRLSELAHKLHNLHIPEGFVLVGAKSPMLTGMMLVAAVDKRYLPGEKDALTTPGFSGNCIGCGATGFRYFTEFSTHINLKLATQPKKQKHLKCYIVQTEDGKWGRGPVIPWKGSENKKRSHLYQNRNPIQLLPSLVDFPQKYAEFHHKSSNCQANDQGNSIPMPTIISNDEPPVKKSKMGTIDEALQPLEDSRQLSPEHVTPVETKDPVEEIIPDSSTIKKADDSLESLNRSISTVCGVRPVLLLCQDLSCKLPNSVNDLIVSDLLVGCFDFPDRLFSKAETETVFLYCDSVMSTDISTESPTEDASREHNAANTLLNMGAASPASDIQAKDQYKNKPWSSVAERLKEAATTTLPLNAAIILFTQYLCSLDGKCINKEQIELLLNKARIEMSTSTITSLFSESQTVAATRTQLSLMINLQCSASNGRVRVMTSNISFQNALYKALQWLNETFYMSKVANKKMHTPNFIIILSTPPTSSIEFGVLVTGISHAKILTECLGINSIVCSNFEESMQKLQSQFNQTDGALNKLLNIYESSLRSKVHTPFNAYSGTRIDLEEGKKQMPKFAPSSAQLFKARDVFSNQAAMAHQLLKQLRNVAENPDILDLASFLRVEIRIVVPATDSLYHMTIKRLCESGVLFHLGLETESVFKNYQLGEKYVIMYTDWSESICKWNKFVESAQSNQDTLHILIFDQAQRYSLPQGMPDVLPNLKEIFESVNVIPVFVTSVPYIFQTNRSFIDPDNEVYWTDTQQGSGKGFSKYIDDERLVLNDKDMLYFGVKELCDSTKWNQQYALIRNEETFDSALPKANRLNDINYSIVQGYVLLRLYQAALMVSGGIKPAEPYAVMSFITMVTDIIESPLQSSDGSGSMLMIRIPNKELGKRFYKVLLNTRNSLGMQYRFDVIFDDGEHELQIGEYFLERMRQWRRIRGWDDEDVTTWKPKCLEELLDLPCFLILSGEQRAGETYPRSLKYADFNIINHSKFHRSTIEAEIGSCACYLNTNGNKTNEPMFMNNTRTPSVSSTCLELHINKDDSSDMFDHFGQYSHQDCQGCLSKDTAQQHNDSCTHFSSKYPLPIILVSKPLWLMLKSEQGGTRGLVHLNSDPNTRWIRSNRPLLMTTKPDRISRYYRRWTEPRPARKMLTTPAAPSTAPSPENDDDNQSHSEMEEILASESKRKREKKRCESEQIDHDDKDDEDSNKEQYHPRCLLFSGPPQAGKTGSYLYFAYLLHRMLMRLKRVDVYDNCITYTPSSYSALPANENMANSKFISNFLDMRREKCSPVHICTKENETHNPVVASMREEGDDKVLVILAKTALYDTFHHCDVCKVYREGIGNMVAQLFSFSIPMNAKEKTDIKLQLVIPLIHLKYFEVNEGSNTIQRLIIPTYNEGFKQGVSHSPLVKSPIFMMSTMGKEEGLLNLFHGMEETDHIHITFVRSSELHQYQKQWPNHVFAALPGRYDKASDSAVKDIMKRFASQNYNTNEEILKSKDNKAKTWPFVLFVPDNLVMWQKYWKEPTCYSSDSEEEQQEKKERHSNGSVRDSITRDTASLLEFLLAVESNDSLLKHALIGVRPWSSFQDEGNIPSFVRTFIGSCFLLDVSKTQCVEFSSNAYCNENIDFHLKLLDENIPTCRYEHFTFMCKVTLHTRLVERDLMLGMESLSTKEIVSRLVVQPDKETMKVIDADPHHVFQKYIKYAGPTLFPLAVGAPEHPVLIIGGYLNLGPSIHVCVINHGDIKQKITQSKCVQAKKYSGIILYMCSKKLNKDCFIHLKFLKNAQLVFVCEERYELRNEALRLDLEEDWRFRLRDEFQTATKSLTERKALFFLTGSYIS